MEAKKCFPCVEHLPCRQELEMSQGAFYNQDVAVGEGNGTGEGAFFRLRARNQTSQRL